MIRVKCSNNKIIYNAYHLVKAFIPDRDVTSELDETSDVSIFVSDEETGRAAEADDIRELYIKMRELTQRELPWGMLTGVRPTKLASKWIEEHISEYETVKQAGEAFEKWFYGERFVSRVKAAAAFNVAMKERAIMPENCIKGYSLYIGIPFCPTVCSYCSFSSGEIGTYADRVEDYLDALCKDMETAAAADCSDENGRIKQPDTVYVGGGTPTSLSADQLDRLLTGADKIFNIEEGLRTGSVREYTVEAGRPDSITREKLEVIKKHGVTRISINPQSMQQKTLNAIGRRHTVEQIRDTFFMAREMGFDNINMDLIAGLPGEDNDDMLDTLRQITDMCPDSLTVHSLAVKRSSRIGIEKRTGKAGEPEVKPDIAKMISDASEAAAGMGMEPYYLYRQKSIAGNFENTGYAKPGKEGLYNVLIMEEVQSIIACGAGASTKIVTEEAVPNPVRKGQLTHLIRRENVKNIEDYIRKYS